MSNGINLIGISKFQHPWRSLQTSRNSGTWGNRGKGNEIQSALEKGLGWIGDKFINGADYIEDGFNYLLTAPLAAVTGKTKEIPRVIDLMRELRHSMSQNYAMNPVFDFISPIKGGWMLKGLMKGSQLEKQLSKAGTININSLLAYLNKASKLELDVIGKILSGQFAGLKNIDYNALRKAVQDELITYSRKPQTEYSTYGMDRIGFGLKKEPDGAGGLVEYAPGIKTLAFTFESPRIPRGNDSHYDITTLGHSRTFTIPDEPDILYVMESQSDWGLLTKDLTPRFTYKRDINGNTNITFDENGKFHYVEDGKGMPYSEFMDLSKPNNEFPFYIAKTQFNETYPHSQVNHLHTNYLQRQLQENMKYAAEQGLKKMRYPTSDTAAKIEGYKKEHRIEFTPEQEAELKRLDDLTGKIMELFYQDYPDAINYPDSKLIEELNKYPGYKEANEALSTLRNSRYDYLDEHKTILKKYADFPKMFNKLFKGLEVRTVTDPKGNTWYEVDIPENFLESEWLFKKGGILGLNKIIGL